MTKLSPRAAAAVSLIFFITLGSAIVGAIYSVISFPDTPFFAIWRGGLTGTVISLLIASFEISLGSGRLQAVRHLPVGALLVLRTVAYTVLIIIGYEFARLVAPADDEGIFKFDHFFWQSVWLSVAASFVINTGLEIARLLGGEVLWGLLVGRYTLPRVEERVVLFVDLKDSTQHAERLGDLKFHGLLNVFFDDISHAVLMSAGSIYKYNGDAAIVQWRAQRGLRRGRALRCVRELHRRLQKRTELYRQQFGLTPGFRAGLHMGPVVVGEIGDQRREIAFSGDAMNTAARIEQATRELGVDFLVSEAVVARMPDKAGAQLRSVGSVAVSGKVEKLALFTADWS
jgi:adenylate cyclase